MKKLVLGLCTMFCVIAAQADWTYTSPTITDGNWVLTTTIQKNTTNLTITGVTSADDCTTLDLTGTISDGTKTYTIVSVGGIANTTTKPVLERVVLPDTVITIGGSAFNGCTALTQVVLPSALTTIGNSAFQDCSLLTTVTPFLPSTVNSIGTSAFRNTPVEVDTFILGADHSVSIGVSGGDAASYAFCGLKVKNLVLGSYVTNLKGWQFQNCKSLTNVVFQGEITSIGHGAFDGCSALKTVSPFLPDTLTYLGRQAFRNCSVLEGDLMLALGGGAMSFGGSGGHSESYAFTGTKINSLTCGTGVASIPGSFLSGVTTLTNIVFSDELKSIGYKAFNDCTSLRTVTPLLPPTVTKVEYYAFYNSPVEGVLTLGVDGNVSYTVEGGNKENYAFGKTHIVEFIAGTNLTSVPGSFLSSTATLTNVNFSATTNLTSIGYRGFYNCSSLANVTFADLKPSFGTDAFASNPSDYRSRFQYPKKSEFWKDYITSLGSNFHEWTSAGDETNNYYTAFPDGPEPRGYTTINNRKKWFVPITDAVAGQVDLTITACPREVGEVVPGYGSQGSVITPLPVSSSQYGIDDGIAYEANGYSINKMGNITWEEVETVPGVSNFNFDPGEDGEFQLEWFWKPVAYAVKLDEIDSSAGSVLISGTHLNASALDGVYYMSNTVVTLTAQAGNLPFRRWYGDVPAGQETATQIQVTMDGVKNIGAYFETPWVYNSGNNTISDGYWTLNVSGSSSSLTVTGVRKQPFGVSILDFTKPTDGHVVTAIGTGAFNGNDLVAHVKLPNSLTLIGADAFRSCSQLKSVIPLLPESVTRVGTFAFAYSPVEGDLVYGANHDVTFDSTGGHATGNSFRETRIGSVTTGPYVTVIRGEQFLGCTALTNVVFNGDITRVGYRTFEGCTSLKSVVPLLPTTLSTLEYSAFRNCPVEGVLTLGMETDVSYTIEGGHSESYAFSGSHITDFIAGPNLTSIPGSFIRDTTTLSNIVFQGKLKSIGYAGFYNNTALKTVTPLLPPTLSSLGYAAFRYGPIEGTLTLGTQTGVSYSTEGGDSQSVAFENSHIHNVYIGPMIGSVAGGLFKNCPELTNVYIEGKPSFGKYVFYGTSADIRFFLDRTNLEWDEWLADTANAAPWITLGDEVKQGYFDAYGIGARIPKARVVKIDAPFRQNGWLMRFTPGTGTILLLK